MYHPVALIMIIGIVIFLGIRFFTAG